MGIDMRSVSYQKSKAAAGQQQYSRVA